MSIFKEAARPNTFLARYMAYCEETETPHAYDLTCGLFLLSCAIGRTIRVERPRAPVYLNLYAILCAEAGTTRKSSAVRTCAEVYTSAGLGGHYLTVTSSTTAEALARDLGAETARVGQAQACVMVSELVTVLGKQQYSAGMPGLLTDLYDCPDQREIRRAGSAPIIVRDAFVNLLAASTPSWLVSAINPAIVEGGFTSRCLFVIEEHRKRRVAWPNATGTEREQLAVLGADLRAVRDGAARHAHRGVTLHDSALRRFVSWYEHRPSDGSDAFTASFEAREDHHVLRLAGLLAANDGSWMISVHHLTHAMRIVSHHKRRAASLFGSQREVHRIVAGVDAVRNTLVAAGELGISQTDLMFKTRRTLPVRELDYLMQLLHELSMVQRYEVSTGGRKRTVWRGTDKLMARDINALLLDRLTGT